MSCPADYSGLEYHSQKRLRPHKHIHWLFTGRFGLQCVSINKTAGAVIWVETTSSKGTKSTKHLLLNAPFLSFLYVLVSLPSLLKIGHILWGYYKWNGFRLYSRSESWQKMTDTLLCQSLGRNHRRTSVIWINLIVSLLALYVISWKKRKTCRQLHAFSRCFSTPQSDLPAGILFFYVCVCEHNFIQIVTKMQGDLEWHGFKTAENIILNCRHTWIFFSRLNLVCLILGSTYVLYI